MRFKVAKRDLEAALQVVGSSLNNSGADISAHFTFRRVGTEGQYGMEVLTYAGQTFSSCPLAAVVFEEVGEKKKTAFTLEGWRLKDWLKCVAADSVPEFALEEGEVTLRVKRGFQNFQTLDPSQFPYWDKVLGEATKTATLPADRLAAALSYSRMFILAPDSEEPEKCVCEVIDGILYSSDKKGVTLIKIPGMEVAGIRVHGKDVSGFTNFLASAGDGDVDVLEHDRNTFLRRCADGAVFGESKFQYRFPATKAKIDDPVHHTWDIPCVELKQAIGFLVAGAVKEDNRLRIAPGASAGEVKLSMENATGKTTTQTLTDITMTSAPKAPEVPEEGFIVDHNVLDRVLSSWKEPVLRFGFSLGGGRGLVRFRHEKLESTYVTIIATLR